MMQKLTPCLWFDGNAEEAVNFYVKTFGNARITETSRFTAETAAVSGQPEGAQRAVQAMLGMTRLDINKLREAYDG